MLPGLEGDRGARRHANARVLTAPPALGPPRPASTTAGPPEPWTGRRGQGPTLRWPEARLAGPVRSWCGRSARRKSGRFVGEA